MQISINSILLIIIIIIIIIIIQVIAHEIQFSYSLYFSNDFLSLVSFDPII
jgi:hypothetical protein